MKRNILLVQLPIPPLGPAPIRGNVPLAAAYLKLFAEQRGLAHDYAIDVLPAPLANTLGDLTKRDLMLTLPKTYRGKHLPHPKAEVLRGAVVELETPEPLPVELDGEQPGTTPARFEVVPQALRLRVPA